MNVNPETPSGQPADPGVGEESSKPTTDAATEKAPTRRKRAPKVLVDEDPVARSAVPAESVDVPSPPERKRRGAAAKAESATSGPSTTLMEPSAISSEISAGSQLELVEPHSKAVPSSSVEPERAVEAGGNPAGSQAGQFDGDGTERSRRRGRNRRRNGRNNGVERDGVDTPQIHATGAALAQPGRDDDDEDETPVKLDPLIVQAQLGEVFSELLSGAFDQEEAASVGASPVAQDPNAEHTALPPKRVLLAEPEAPKLQKVLAQSGIGSRRDMEQMILDGLIKVNGQVAHVGQRISFGDQIKVDGKPIRVRIVPPPPRIIAYHKAVGEVVTHDDPQQRPTVFRRLPRLPHGKWQSVGRLDINTEGLLLFTNSGELANKLMHPRFGVEREYAVRVLGTLTPDAKAKLLAGVEIDGQSASFLSIEDGGGEGVNHWYRVVITEGRNREVRKLFDAVGLTVSRLIRIRYGTVVLPRGLKRGVWTDLENNDVKLICQLAGHVQQPRQGPSDRNNPPKTKVANRPNARRDERKPDRGPERGRGPNPDVNGPRDGRGPSRGRPGEQRRHNGSAPAHARPETSSPREEGWEDDFDPARIPNPLEQTFDKRFVQHPRSPAGGRGFRTGGGGFGAGGSAPDAPPHRKAGGAREPDPLQTSVGYIGGDAFHRKGGRGGGRGGGFGNSGGGGFGGTGRRGR